MRIKLVFLVIFLNIIFFNRELRGQNFFGIGLNAGTNSGIGAKMELYNSNFIGIEAGADWQRFNVFAYHAGLNICPFQNYTNQNTWWVGMNYNFSKGAGLTVEKDEIFYTYSLNNLNRINYHVGYKRTIEPEEYLFSTLGIHLNYRQLLNPIELIDLSSGTNTPSVVSEWVTNYFDSGFSISVDLIIYFHR